MKLLTLLTAFVLTGCGSLPSLLHEAIPDGKWDTVLATVNGKFSATTITGAGVIKNGKQIVAKDLHVRHSNAWLTLVEFHGTGYITTAEIDIERAAQLLKDGKMTPAQVREAQDLYNAAHPQNPPAP